MPDGLVEEIMRRGSFGVLGAGLSCLLLLSLGPKCRAQGQDTIRWEHGPAVGRLGSIAQIKIPKGYRFSGKEGALKVLELTKNVPNGSELGVLIPEVNRGGDFWFAIFEFRDIGYVKDDEKGKLDAGAILESIRKSTEESNKTLAARGWPSIHVIGWMKSPFYNPLTNNLTWAVRGYTEEPGKAREDVVNYSVRVLGRQGTMNVDLILDPDVVAKGVPELESVLEGFSFLPGQTYAEFRRGDKVAAYGLTALIVGGAAAAAAKTGLLAKLWKLLVAIAVGIVAALKKIIQYIRRLLSGKASEEEPTAQG